MTQPIICSIHKSIKKEGMYLYVDGDSGLKAVPESLLKMFGKPVFVMKLRLAKTLKLAQVDRELVEQALIEQGYYLQIPPSIVSLLKRPS